MLKYIHNLSRFAGDERLGARLALCFGLLIATLIGLGGLRLHQLRHLDAAIWASLLLIALEVLLSICIAVFVFRTIGRHIETRKRTEQLLLQARINLENKVVERTAELTESNDALLRELQQR